MHFGWMHGVIRKLVLDRGKLMVVSIYIQVVIFTKIHVSSPVHLELEPLPNRSGLVIPDWEIYTWRATHDVKGAEVKSRDA